MLGWIKSAIEFIRMPAGPQKAEPPPSAPADAPPKIDTEPELVSAGQTEGRHDIPAGVAPAAPLDIESVSRISVEPEGPPSQEEIDRRRGIVRAFFNDYWSSIDDKPSSFAERLDRAEEYINERVAAGGESWRLGAATRKQLGLPPSKKR